jgi:elongation factor Ts
MSYAPSMEDIKTLREKTSAGLGLCKEALVTAEGDMQKATDYINAKSDVISRIHNLTGAKMGLIKVALQDADSNFEKAVELINERGWGDETAMGEVKEVKEGILDAYVHGTDHKTIAIAEVTCQTDFVAKNEDFKNFAHEVAMQVAAMGAKYVSKEVVPAADIEKLKELYQREVEAEGKPAEIAAKIVEGKLNKYFQENCLLSQKWFKDDTKTMQNLLDAITNKIGESITVRRVLIWRLGDKI